MGISCDRNGCQYAEIERMRKELRELAEDCRLVAKMKIRCGQDDLVNGYERVAGYLDHIGRTNG